MEDDDSYSLKNGGVAIEGKLHDRALAVLGKMCIIINVWSMAYFG